MNYIVIYNIVEFLPKKSMNDVELILNLLTIFKQDINYFPSIARNFDKFFKQLKKEYYQGYQSLCQEESGNYYPLKCETNKQMINYISAGNYEAKNYLNFKYNYSDNIHWHRWVNLNKSNKSLKDMKWNDLDFVENNNQKKFIFIKDLDETKTFKNPQIKFVIAKPPWCDYD